MCSRTIARRPIGVIIVLKKRVRIHIGGLRPSWRLSSYDRLSVNAVICTLMKYCLFPIIRKNYIAVRPFNILFCFDILDQIAGVESLSVQPFI
jgi:hypothetical protein